MIVSEKNIIKTRDCIKSYNLGDSCITVLKSVNLSVSKGEYVSIMGQSGSGKSTFLNILGCLDTPTSGHYFFEGTSTSTLSGNQLADIRNKQIGFVFQNFNLLPKLSVLANVELPLIYNNTPRAERRERANDILNHFGIWERRHHKPNEISGGQKQRVAIARALVKKPSIIFADEPTGNLDSKTTNDILAVFDRLHSEQNTIVIITHENEVAQRAHKHLHLIDGCLNG